MHVNAYRKVCCSHNGSSFKNENLKHESINQSSPIDFFFQIEICNSSKAFRIPRKKFKSLVRRFGYQERIAGAGAMGGEGRNVRRKKEEG